jgi:hypothetical protein
MSRLVLLLLPLSLTVLLALALTACVPERPGLVAPGILYVPTPEVVGVEMLRLAGTTASDVVYDLGSGDGRLVIAAAREFGARGVGVEIDAGLVQTSRESAAKAGVADQTSFLWQDLFAIDIAEATVVTLYLGEALNLKLRPHLLSVLRPGTRVVSHSFAMADWTPDHVHYARGPDGEHTLYLWRIPAQVAGTWEVTLGDGAASRAARLELRQHFQQLTGTLDLEGRARSLTGVLNGSALELEAEGWTLSGRVEGDQAMGRATEDGRAPAGWVARRRPGG